MNNIPPKKNWWGQGNPEEDGEIVSRKDVLVNPNLIFEFFCRPNI